MNELPRAEPPGNGQYFVRSAEGRRSTIAITKLGPTEYKRRLKEICVRLRNSERGSDGN